MPGKLQPLFAGRVSLDTFYEKAAVFAGEPIRCCIEIRAPSDVSLKETARLRLLTLQVIGTITAVNTTYRSQLPTAATIGLYGTNVSAIDSEDRAFEAAVLEDAEKLLNIRIDHHLHHNQGSSTPAKTSPTLSSAESFFSDTYNDKHDSNKRHTAKHRRQPSKNCELPDISYSPPLDANTALFMKSFPQVICDNEIFSKPDDIRTFGFECLLPPGLPPSFGGSFFKYSYSLSVVAIRDDKANPLHLNLPLMILGPEEGILDCWFKGQPKIIDFRFCSSQCPQSHRLTYAEQVHSDLFEFSTLSWCKGNTDCQFGCYPAVTSSLGISTLLCRDVLNGISQLETSHLLRRLARASNRIEDDEGAEPFGYIDNYYSLSNQEPEIFRVSQEGHFIATIQFLHPLMATSNVNATSSAMSFETLHVFSNVRQLPHSINCSFGRTIIARINFAEATLRTFEVHVLLIREEIVRQTSSAPFVFGLFSFAQQQPDSGTINDYESRRTVCAEIKKVVLLKEIDSIRIDLPQTLTRSFFTDLVMLRYMLVFHFFCQSPNSNEISSFFTVANLNTLKPSDIMELSWTVGLTVTPPPIEDRSTSHSVDVVVPPELRCQASFLTTKELPEGSKVRYSPAGVCWHLKDAFKRVYRGVLL